MNSTRHRAAIFVACTLALPLSAGCGKEEKAATVIMAPPVLVDTGPGDIFQHQQLGWMRTDASVETSATPAGNNVNQMVDMIILNYMALHGEEGLFDTSGFFPAQGLGDITNRERFIAFQQMTSVSGGVLS